MKSPWPTKKLGEVLISLESGSRPKGGVRHISEGVPSIGAEHLDDNGGFSFEKIKFIPREFYEKLRRGVIKHGDVLIVKDGATTGRISLVTKKFPFREAAVNEHVFILRPDTKQILSEYLFRFLFSGDGQGQILSTFHGAAQGGINLNFVNYINIPLPPISEQKRIVAKIEKLFAKIDQAERLRRESLSASSALLPSALHQIFSRAKPEKWPTKKLGELCDFQNGLWKGKKPPFKKCAVIRNTNFRNGGYLDLSNVAEIEVEERQLVDRLLQKGDLILERSGGGPTQPVGRVVYFDVDGQFSFSNFTTRIRVKDQKELNSKYLWRYLNQLYISGATETLQKQTTGIRNLDFTEYKNLKIPLPPISEQKRIVAYLDSLSVKARELQTLQQQTAADFSALRQSVLHKAFAK